MTGEIRASHSFVTQLAMILVEILVTDDCPHEDDAINLVAMAAQGIGIAPRLLLVEVADLDQAEDRQFVGSPTIRVNGRDVDPPPAGQDAAALSCRLYDTTHGPSGVPEFGLIRSALEHARATDAPTT